MYRSPQLQHLLLYIKMRTFKYYSLMHFLHYCIKYSTYQYMYVSDARLHPPLEL